MREKSAAVSLHDFERHRQAPCPNVQLAPEANGGNISFQFETADFEHVFQKQGQKISNIKRWVLIII